MREVKSFAERSKVLKDDQPLKKYFLVCEGARTENIYFNLIANNRGCLKINPLVEIISITRGFNEIGLSNPKVLFECLEKNLKEQEQDEYSYETIINNIMDYLLANNLISKIKPSEIKSSKIDKTKTNVRKEDVNKLLNEIMEELGVKKNDTTSNFLGVCNLFISKLKIKRFINNVKDIMEQAKISYEKDFDQICIIVDRDDESFTEIQFEQVLKTCKEKNYSLYVTNPRFEFWLLLHYNDISDLDEKKIKENTKVKDTNEIYLESELHKRFKSYSKSSKSVERLALQLDIAIENVKKYCEDINMLKNNIGSNIGALIQKLRG